MPKPKPCPICKNPWERFNSMQKVCSPRCAVEYVNLQNTKAKAKDEKAFRAETTRLRTDFNSKNKKFQLDKLQALVNKYVRLRDYMLGCVSCDKPRSWGGQWHASHYFSRGHSSYLRFNLWNIHKGCSECNNMKSGNIASYNPRIIEKIGQDNFDYMMTVKSQTISYDIEYVKRAIKVVGKGIKRLERRL